VLHPGGPVVESPLEDRRRARSISSLKEASVRNRELKGAFLALPHQMPLPDYRVVSGFGVRVHPITGVRQRHAGVDLVSVNGDDRVFPTLPGKVIMARDYYGYGKTVIVKHNRGIESLYAHPADIHIAEGQEGDVATVLGLVGNTGVSTGKHLHFEISVGGYTVDPINVIKTAQYVQQAKIELR